MWLVRIWKIAQIDQIAAEQEKRPEDLDAGYTAPTDETTVTSRKKKFQSSTLRRIVTLKKV